MKSYIGRTKQRRVYTNAPSPVDQLTQPITSNGSAAKPIATALPAPFPARGRIPNLRREDILATCWHSDGKSFRFRKRSYSFILETPPSPAVTAVRPMARRRHTNAARGVQSLARASGNSGATGAICWESRLARPLRVILNGSVLAQTKLEISR